MTAPARRTASLTPEETVAAARRLLDAEGVDGFTMRKLAAALHVNPMTIYLRFENKEALLAAVAREALDEIRLPARRGSWEDQAIALAKALRERLLADHGTAAVLLRNAGNLPLAVLRVTDRGLTLMQEAGYTGAGAVVAFRALFWHTVGFALSDGAMRAVTTDNTSSALAELHDDDVPVYRALRGHFVPLDPDALFALATRRLVEGLAAAAPTVDGADRTPGQPRRTGKVRQARAQLDT